MTLVRPVQQVARLSQDERVAAVVVSPDPHFYVIAAGVQGPVGIVAEEVLARTAAVELQARKASQEAAEATETLTSLMQQLQGAFEYHAGAISAQEGK